MPKPNLSMSKHSDLVYLKHIADAVGRLEELAARGGRELFDKDFAIQDAVIRELEVIGMRHRLIHGYATVDLNRIWDTVTTDIPGLKDQVNKILADEDLI